MPRCTRLLPRPTAVAASRCPRASFLHAAQLRQRSTSTDAPATASLSPRWLSDVKARVGKCITFGLTPAQVGTAAGIMQEIARDWRELVAGSEGFLTGPDRRGLHRQEVVWGEMDSMAVLIMGMRSSATECYFKGHVNNVTYNRYAESARIKWAQRYARDLDPQHAKQWTDLWTPTGVGLILKSIKTDFKFPMKFPDHVTVYHKLGQEPTDRTESFILDVLIMSELHQRPAARCVEDIVVYDYKKGEKTSLRPFMAAAFEETWRLQEEAKSIYSQKVRNLLDRVQTLEKQSWDRADAVEDLGSAAQ